jgi:formamidopyrimidine-DNA glycosylase
MPELPEVETVRIGLERQIAGSAIEDVVVGDFPGVIDGLSVEQFRRSVIGRSFTKLERRGKYLLLGITGDLSIMVHLRMTGQLLVVKSDDPATRFERLRLDLADGLQLRFADQRKFGRVALFTPDDVRALDARLGIEPLSDAFTSGWLKCALKNRFGMIKPLLLDQRFIAGIGNIYADEALYRAGIHPMSSAGSLSTEQIVRLHREIRLVLRESINRRGTTFSSYRDSSGESGTNQYSLLVYGLGRLGHPCVNCGATLVCITVGGRSSHICPACQVLRDNDMEAKVSGSDRTGKARL